jgi:hypothetical protein
VDTNSVYHTGNLLANNIVAILGTTAVNRATADASGNTISSTYALQSTSVSGGNGLTGGGTLDASRTINVVSANDGITVNTDNIQLNAINNLTSTSTTKPLSAAQGKALNDRLAVFEKWFKDDGSGNIKTTYNFYSTKQIAAGDIGEEGGSGSGGVILLDSWTNMPSNLSGYALGATLGKDLNTRVSSLESGSALNFTTSGNGNVISGVSKSGTTVTFTKGVSALTSHQTIYTLTFASGSFSTGSFIANSANKTINIPTATSHLSNDSGFITTSSIPSALKSPYSLTINNSDNNAVVVYNGGEAKSIKLTKSIIGLSNVDNTSDANKSVKYAATAGSAPASDVYS